MYLLPCPYPQSPLAGAGVIYHLHLALEKLGIVEVAASGLLQSLMGCVYERGGRERERDSLYLSLKFVLMPRGEGGLVSIATEHYSCLLGQAKICNRIGSQRTSGTDNWLMIPTLAVAVWETQNVDGTSLTTGISCGRRRQEVS